VFAVSRCLPAPGSMARRVPDDGLDIERRLCLLEQAMEIVPDPRDDLDERLTVVERAVHRALLDALYERELARQRP
jgi:hypothetical protein